MTASKSIRSFNDRKKPKDKMTKVHNCQACGAKFPKAMVINERYGATRVLCSPCYTNEETRYGE